MLLIVILLPRCMQGLQRGLAMRKLFVCPSVRPFVKRVDSDKMKESSAQIFKPYEMTFVLVLLARRMVGGGRPLLLEILGQADPVGPKSPIFSR